MRAGPQIPDRRVPVNMSTVAGRKLRENCMNSEIIVILVLVALAVIGLVYLEMHSRRNSRSEGQKPPSTEGD